MRRLSLLCIAACLALAVSQYIVRFEHGTLLGVDQDGWGGFIQGLGLGVLILFFWRRRSSPAA
ncbi:hypothetical protein [Sphingomonas crusticola]|uniref:hypothetical protein n=1 Tax=Sphingomonas crusticola TaxID=1697973 RepID=UPI0013C31EC8|nr:hypothetical protein [Sphingomonas crusticola]